MLAFRMLCVLAAEAPKRGKGGALLTDEAGQGNGRGGDSGSGNNIITQEQLRELMRAADVGGGDDDGHDDDEARLDAVLERMFAMMDADGDGEVSLSSVPSTRTTIVGRYRLDQHQQWLFCCCFSKTE